MILVDGRFHYLPILCHLLIEVFTPQVLVVTHCRLDKGDHRPYVPSLSLAERNKFRQRDLNPLPQGHLKCDDVVNGLGQLDFVNPLTPSP